LLMGLMRRSGRLRGLRWRMFWGMIECWIVRVRYEDCFVSRALDMTSAIALASEKMHKLRGDIKRLPLRMA
jgi:hypothetical protein